MINFQIKTLKNGIRLITCPLTSTEATTFQLLVGTGARFDPPGKSGISHFLEHMFLAGSKNYPAFSDVTQAFDSVGAGYNASTSYEAIRFYVQTGWADFEKGYDVIRDCLRNPLFKEDYLERERGVILEEIKMYRDMPQAWVGVLNQQQTYPGSPLGADLGGTKETVLSITRKDLLNNWKEHYSPQSMIIALAGKFTDKTIKMIEDDFEAIPHIPIKKFIPFDQRGFRSSVNQEVRKINQANFVISFPAIKKPDERRFSENLMNLIFGASASSRLYTEIREKRGLAYDVGSEVNAYFDTGSYCIYGGVMADKMEEVYQVVIDQANLIKEQGVSTQELKRAKGNLRGTLTRRLESGFAIADYLCSSLYWHGRIISAQEVLEKYEEVSREDIQAIATQIFDPAKAIVTIIGPKEYKI